MKSPEYQTITAIAHPNIAFIKYWGNRDDRLRLPCNSSLSCNLSGLETRTSVRFNPSLPADSLILSGERIDGPALSRVSAFLDIVRLLADRPLFAEVTSANNFPAGAGIASSASAFAALALAASKAIGLDLEEKQLSRLARRGSGSASRSIPNGFVEWQAGSSDADSYAFSIAPAEHWELVDLVCVLDTSHKSVDSTGGHALAHTSPLQHLRLLHVNERLELCRKAILERDFELFARVVEEDSNLMHAVMRTSSPSLVYWLPETEVILWTLKEWRNQGRAVCATVDAGPNVHVLTLPQDMEWTLARLKQLPGVKQVLQAPVGQGARLLPSK
ncbi:MAG: diphosphomevalonate decarboxylase [Chloroflexi bacterium]|jgi:diphosphomevalonate decarboxylase|nr:diphosphomevalonate decarboxylase [Chloroflexota bacterium]